MKSWYSKAKILGIFKEMPIQYMVSGIAKDRQGSYNHSYGLHGSNGTYVVNASACWRIKYRVYKIAPNREDAAVFCSDIHAYITTELMPCRNWHRITSGRLEEINGKIKGVKLNVITYDMEEAPIYRTYVPDGYKNWGDFLDTLLG